MNNKFKKCERLCSYKKIKQLSENGQYLCCFKTIKVQWVIDVYEGVDKQVLIHVPKKCLKKAVDRNLVRRRMREVYRLYKNKLIVTCKKTLLLKYTYLLNNIASYDDIKDDITNSINELQNIINDYPLDNNE